MVRIDCKHLRIITRIGFELVSMKQKGRNENFRDLLIIVCSTMSFSS